MLVIASRTSNRSCQVRTKRTITTSRENVVGAMFSLLNMRILLHRSLREMGERMCFMVRQCAWCLRLINNAGEPISVFPMPKRYDASHGMCRACGVRWMESVESSGPTGKEEPIDSQNGVMITPRPDEMASPMPLRRVLPAPEPLQPKEANDSVQPAELCFA